MPLIIPEKAAEMLWENSFNSSLRKPGDEAGHSEGTGVGAEEAGEGHVVAGHEHPGVFPAVHELLRRSVAEDGSNWTNGLADLPVDGALLFELLLNLTCGNAEARGDCLVHCTDSHCLFAVEGVSDNSLLGQILDLLVDTFALHTLPCHEMKTKALSFFPFEDDFVLLVEDGLQTIGECVAVDQCSGDAGVVADLGKEVPVLPANELLNALDHCGIRSRRGDDDVVELAGDWGTKVPLSSKSSSDRVAVVVVLLDSVDADAELNGVNSGPHEDGTEH
mmetsp:Transcript_3571/g.5516  ORF Transcript_3571/g.5516 Transcript_3571/m.5516 type:complete len:277 (-) Transcript_3571:163-993(-)